MITELVTPSSDWQGASMSNKAHQRIIREKEAEAPSLLGNWWEDVDKSLSAASVREITSQKAAEIILRYEWLGSMPQAITRCFGFYHEDVLAGACVFAEKPGANLQSDKTSQVPPDALYLARGACAHWAHEHAASWFLSRVGLILAPCSILAYSDPAAGEVGTIYQALGWHYLGPSEGGPTAALVDGKLITLRSFKRDRGGKGGQSIDAVRRSFPRAVIEAVGRKGRYVGIFGDRRYKKTMAARFTSLPYPKRA